MRNAPLFNHWLFEKKNERHLLALCALSELLTSTFLTYKSFNKEDLANQAAYLQFAACTFFAALVCGCFACTLTPEVNLNIPRTPITRIKQKFSTLHSVKEQKTEDTEDLSGYECEDSGSEGGRSDEELPRTRRNLGQDFRASREYQYLK